MGSATGGKAVPVLIVLLALLVIWYVGAVLLNAPVLLDNYARNNTPFAWSQFILDAWGQDRPVLPSPHQVAIDFWKSTVGLSVGSKKSLVYHSWVTLSATLLGFVVGTLFGIGLAILIVHNDASD